MTDETEVNNAFNAEEKVLDTLVGEGKKFRDAEALARGKKEADDFITRLQAENAMIREELKKRPTEEDIAKKVKESLQSSTTTTTQTNGANQPSISEESLVPTVRKIMAGEQERTTQTTNIASVTKKLDDLYGDRQKAQAFLVTKANELGVSVKYLEQTAATSPKAFYNLVGVADTPNTSSSTSVKSKGTINTENFNKAPSEDSWEYYQKLRRENKAKYFSPAVQNELHRKVKEGKITLPQS